MDVAFRVAQGAMAGQAGRALMQIGARAAAGEGAPPDLLRERQGISSALDAIETKLALAGADTVALTGEADALGQQLAGIDARIGTGFPRFRALTRPRPLSVAEVRDLLHPDEALILTYVGDHSSYIVAAGKTSAAWHRLAVERGEVARIVAALRAKLDPSGAPVRAAEVVVPVAPQGLPFDRFRASVVCDYLLRPLEPQFVGPRRSLSCRTGL